MIVWALALVASQAQAPAQPVSAAPVLLPAGTPVHLVTVGEISSRSAIQGQRFELQVADDVRIGPNVVIPQGAQATGEVEAVSGTGMFGKGARLVLQPLFIDVGGSRVNLVGETEQQGKDATAGAAVTTFITPFGLLITGKSAVMPKGSAMYARVRTDVTFSQR